MESRIDSGIEAAAAARRDARRRSTRLSVIIPATNEPPTLKRALSAVRSSLYPGEELTVVTEPPNTGPAEARNLGAADATGDVLVFVDADVVVHADAFARLRIAFDADPGLTAVFGSYDDGPSSPAVISQFRNLLHHHVHQSYPGEASTFWAGLGAVRRDAFLEVGGFDVHRYAVPSIEDIELGARLSAAGHRIELHPRVKGTHLKHWTMGNMLRTDLVNRGIPWVGLMLESRSAPTTLNLSWRERLSTILTLVAMPLLALRRPRAFAALMALLGVINGPFYWLLVRRMGVIRAAMGVGLHALHRVVAVVSVPAGLVVHFLPRTNRLMP
jgi:cellulose synthase/poly-beta-1,6-N-acetylglucosamine synthase-like glycosyltransferase